MDDQVKIWVVIELCAFGGLNSGIEKTGKWCWKGNELHGVYLRGLRADI